MNTSDLERRLKGLFLSQFALHHQTMAEHFEKEGKSHLGYLEALAQLEEEYRHQQRIKRLIKQAKLPRDKFLRDFEISAIPGLGPSTIERLAKGGFIDQYENVLIFGNPGTGKTHLSMALAREWCLQGRRVYFTDAASLVQQLLKAKVALELERFIKRLDQFELLLIDDISYVPFERTETDVLFTLLSARYETRSVLITSNLPFGKWNNIFKDEMTTAAAIDRLVHHATILELNADESYRMREAKKRNEKVKNRAKEEAKMD